MSETPKSYQPGWGEKKHHHHHHHHHNTTSDKYTNSWGGWMKMRDRQAYFGLMIVVIAALGYGGYKLVELIVNEYNALPKDDPTTEMKVDELDVRRVEKEEALMMSDSIAQLYQFDSTKIKKVQTESHHVYRPPRKEDKWYITQREWKSIWKDYKVMRWERKQKKEKDQKANKD